MTRIIKHKNGVAERRKNALERLEKAYASFKSENKDKFNASGELVRTYAQELNRMEKEIDVLKAGISGVFEKK